MAIVGFSFIKIDAQRKKNSAKGGIEVKHNLSVADVEKTSLTVGGGKSDVLRIEFAFDVFYGESLGNISIHGDVIYTDTKEIIEETANSWAKDKNLSDLVREQVNKFAYNKCIVKSIEISDSLNLPSPIPMPKLSFKKKK